MLQLDFLRSYRNGRFRSACTPAIDHLEVRLRCCCAPNSDGTGVGSCKNRKEIASQLSDLDIQFDVMRLRHP